MSDEVFKSVFLPLALIFVLFGMGMSLTVGDFKRVMLSPLASAVGLSCQLILLPFTAFAVAWILGIRGETAVGLMLLAACPGGPTSNLISHLSKGDVALSVTLTMTYFLGSGAAIELPFLKTLLQLVVVTLVPIALGMGVRAARPGFADRMARPANVLSMVFLALVILLAVLREDNLGGQFLVAGPGAVTLNVLSMLLAFSIAKLFRLPRTQQITISIEAGIQNGTLALAIALGILGNPHIAMPAVIYSLFMFVSGGAMIWRFGSGPLKRIQR
jgi:BASS family bile acid:Na+ symporter